MKAASISPAIPTCKLGPAGGGGPGSRPCGLVRLSRFVLTASLAANGAYAADTLELARKLVRVHRRRGIDPAQFRGRHGGVRPARRTSLCKASNRRCLDNKPTLDAANEKLAQSLRQALSRRPDGGGNRFLRKSGRSGDHDQEQVTRYGVIVWPDPNAPGVSSEQSAAPRQISRDCEAAAPPSPPTMSDATDAIMAAETDALVKVRAAAFADYCKTARLQSRKSDLAAAIRNLFYILPLRYLRILKWPIMVSAPSACMPAPSPIPPPARGRRRSTRPRLLPSRTPIMPRRCSTSRSSATSIRAS